ncbi:hypothetical protein Tco_1242990, partial [Tanacetum coccineum]
MSNKTASTLESNLLLTSTNVLSGKPSYTDHSSFSKLKSCRVCTIKKDVDYHIFCGRTSVFSDWETKIEEGQCDVLSVTRFTKLVRQLFMDKDLNSSKKQVVPGHLAISINQNEDIRNSESYKSIIYCFRTIPPKRKGKAEQLKIITKRSRQETHSSHASGSGADEGTGVSPGVPDAPDYVSKDDISWKSSNDDQDDEQAQDDEDADKNDVNETTQDDDEHDNDEKAQDDDDEEQTESDDDGDDFIHPKLTTHDDDIIHEEETDEDDSFEPTIHTPSRISSSDDEDSDNEVQGTNVDDDKVSPPRHQKERREKDNRRHPVFGRIGKKVSGTQTANLQNLDTHENNDWCISVRDRLSSRDVHNRLGQRHSPNESPPSSDSEDSRRKRRRRVSSSSEDSSDNEDAETGHWKSKNKYRDDEDEDMSRPWRRQKVDAFTRRISDFSEDKKRRMPANVKTYDGTGDPDDHLKIFESAATIENWPQPVWCHMFNSTLVGNARNWFSKLPRRSIDGFKELRRAFRLNFTQRKKCAKNPVELAR